MPWPSYCFFSDNVETLLKIQQKAYEVRIIFNSVATKVYHDTSEKVI
jgi:hypothetical protein